MSGRARFTLTTQSAAGKDKEELTLGFQKLAGGKDMLP